MLNTGQALPLRQRRTWCPRMSRGGHAESPRAIGNSWTWHRPVHGLDSAANRSQTRILQVREQSVSAFSPHKQSWARTIHINAQAAASTVRGQAAASDAECSQSVRRRELSTSTNPSRLRFVHERGLAKRCSRRCITVSILSSVNFPVHVQTLPPHVRV